MGVQAGTVRDSEISDRASRTPFVVRIRSQMMFIALALIWIFFAVMTEGTFLSARNMSLLLRQVAILGIAATGMVMLLITAQIDLSVGSTFALFAGGSAILEAWFGWSTLAAFLVCLGGGLVVGAIHGVIVASLDRPFAAFPVTLGGYLIWRGVENLLSGGIVVSPINPSHEFFGSGYLPMPLSYVLLGVITVALLGATAWGLAGRKRRGASLGAIVVLKGIVPIVVFAGFMAYVISFKGMPVPVLITLTVAAIFQFITRRTDFGRQLYAIGGNRQAARFSGINIRRATVITFLLMGLLYAIGGLVFVGRLGVAEPNMGAYLELDAIAACVIGGAALMGGQGTVFGALLGALVLGSLDNGMSVLAVSSFWRLVVKGLVLFVVVYVDVAARRYART